MLELPEINGNTFIHFINWLETNVQYHVFLAGPEGYLEPCQTSKMERFLLTVFAQWFILDVWQDSEYASKAHKILFEIEPPVSTSCSF